MFRRKESPELQVYGKLPLAKDYLRIGASSGASMALRSWLDEGFSGGPRGERQPRLAWPARFIIGSRWGGAPLLGVAWPSSDTGGLRKFPFCMWVERKKKALVEELAGGLDDLERWFAPLEQLHTAHKGMPDGRSLLDALRAKHVVPQAEAPEQLPRIDWDVWLDVLFGADGEAELEAVARLVQRAAQDQRAAGVRLPLVSNLDVLQQAHAWLRLIQHVWADGASEVPTLFFPQRTSAEGEAFMVWFPATPRPADAMWLDAQAPAEGALVPSAARCFDGSRAMAENGPVLADSIRAILMRIPGGSA